MEGVKNTVLVIVFLALKIVLNVIVSAQFNAKRFSKYDRRHNLK